MKVFKEKQASCKGGHKKLFAIAMKDQLDNKDGGTPTHDYKRAIHNKFLDVVVFWSMNMAQPVHKVERNGKHVHGCTRVAMRSKHIIR